MLNCIIKITWSNKVEYKNNNNEHISACGGVYEIQGKKKTDGEFTRKYVGTSDNLRQIYSKHLSDDESNDQLKNFLKEKKSFFRYIKSESEQTRKDLEKGLYYKHKHSLINNTSPPVGSGKYMKIKIEERNP